MSIVFFGSSDFSIPSLKACLQSKHKVVKVISTPARKKGRGLVETPTPVAEFAAVNNLAVVTPENLKSPELLAEIQSLKPDFFVVSSYGKMIPPSWLKVAQKLNLNVHPSLLPKYRGASPINAPILHGDAETAISIAEVTDKLDAGDIFYQQRVPIPAGMDSLALENHLAELSVKALSEVFSQIAHGSLKRTIQDESKTTYAPKLKKEDGVIRWSDPAEKISCQVRGLLPWPAAYTFFESEPLQILKAAVIWAESSFSPGMIAAIEKQGGIHIQTGKGMLNALRVKPSGKSEMSGADFARGRKLSPGQSLSETQRNL